MANLNVTELSNQGVTQSGALADTEGGTVAFNAVIIDGTKRSVTLDASARVVRLEPEADCHIVKGSGVTTSSVTTGDEILKTGQIYYKQVNGGETISIVQV